MKRITSKTILKQKIGEENCKCIKPKKIFKTYQPIEVDGVVYWVDESLIIKDVRPYYGKFHFEKGVAINKFPTYLTDLSECRLIVAQSQPKLEGVPVIDFNDFVNENGELPYIQKDIERTIELAQRFNLVDGFSEPKYEKEEILEQINSISVIEVDESFNVLSYE